MSARRGMSLIEVVVAMMILTGVVLVLGSFSARFAQASNQARLIVNANEAAARRLDAIRQQPNYAAIDSMAKTDTITVDFVKDSIRTQVVRIGGAVTDSVDYKIVTVTVWHPQMKKRVTKSTAVAAF